MEAPHEESRESRRETGLHVTMCGAEGWTRLGACVGDLARVQPVTRCGSGGGRRA
jgi:hypothetical protein